MTTPGLSGCGLLPRESNPESSELSEELLLKDLVRGRSIDALYVHGLCVIGTKDGERLGFMLYPNIILSSKIKRCSFFYVFLKW